MPSEEIVSRRSFLGASGAAVGAALDPREGAAAPQPGAGRPNVIVFFTDQQRWDSVGAYGSPMGLTPHLDRMAGEGVRFEHAFTTQPVCAPARSTMQTGKYPTATGVIHNGLTLKDDEQTLAHHFKRAGYQTGYIGKWHLGGTGTNPVPLDAAAVTTNRGSPPIPWNSLRHLLAGGSSTRPISRWNSRSTAWIF